MRGRDRSRATICFIGAGTTMRASAPARIAASPSTAAKRALSAIKSPEAWLAEVEASGHGFASEESLSAAESADEYLLMGLRLSEGIDLARLAAIGGSALDEARIERAGRAKACSRGKARRLAATPKGRLVLNRLILELAA